MTSKQEAIQQALSAEKQGFSQELYWGTLYPDLHDAIFDVHEGCWAVRVLEEPIPFSCGLNCCGIDRETVVAIW